MQTVLQGLQLQDTKYIPPSKIYWENFPRNRYCFILFAQLLGGRASVSKLCLLLFAFKQSLFVQEYGLA